MLSFAKDLGAQAAESLGLCARRCWLLTGKEVEPLILFPSPKPMGTFPFSLCSNSLSGNVGGGRTIRVRGTPDLKPDLESLSFLPSYCT